MIENSRLFRFAAKFIRDELLFFSLIISSILSGGCLGGVAAATDDGGGVGGTVFWNTAAGVTGAGGSVEGTGGYCFSAYQMRGPRGRVPLLVRLHLLTRESRARVYYLTCDLYCTSRDGNLHLTFAPSATLIIGRCMFLPYHQTFRRCTVSKSAALAVSLAVHGKEVTSDPRWGCLGLGSWE